MTAYTGELVAAVTAAGYPPPHPQSTDEHALAWTDDSTGPAIRVDDTGRVSVLCAGQIEAEFTLGPDRQSAADWIALLHPNLAAHVADTTGSTPIPEPESVVQRQATLVWLAPDHDGTYAVYTDNARIRVSDKAGVSTASELVGTDRGNRLGITADTVIPVLSAHHATVMINPNLATSTAIDTGGTWVPAITFTDRRGFLDRAHDARPNGVPVGQFRDFSAPVLALGLDARFNAERDAVAAAEATVRITRRRLTAVGADPIAR
jgi:hypothetical protein